MVRILFYCLITLCLISLIRCLPASLQTEVLSPKSIEGKIYNLNEVLSFDNVKHDNDPFNDNVAVIGIDSMYIFFIVWEMENIYLIDAYFVNNSKKDKLLKLDQFDLFAGNYSLRRLTPDKAANLFLKKTSGKSTYKPKVSYEIETSTKGHIDEYGNYTEKSNSKIKSTEDAAYNVGYLIGSLIRDSKNQKLENMADDIYNNGFTELIEVPYESTTKGSMYWNRNISEYPLRLRLKGTDTEIEFNFKK